MKYNDYVLNAKKNNIPIMPENEWNELNNIYTEGKKVSKMVDDSNDRKADQLLSFLERTKK